MKCKSSFLLLQHKSCWNKISSWKGEITNSPLLKILCLSAPLLGIINMITSYFQALGKALKSLIITVLRNAVLFIPGVIILNYFWKLDGVIAAQPVVEMLLTIICILMYIKDIKTNN